MDMLRSMLCSISYPYSSRYCLLYCCVPWEQEMKFTLKSSIGIFAFLFSVLPHTTSAAEFTHKGCEYSVSFPGTPKKYSLQQATADGEIIPLYGAELDVGNGAGTIRAECASTEGRDLSQFNSSSFTAYMHEVAKDLGLSRPSFEVKQSSLGYIGTVTGVKDSKRGRITARVINVIGDSSILTLYLMAFSKDFQTPEMSPFVQSIKKK